MNQKIITSPPNSLIFVMDHAAGELPGDMAGNLVASTSSCVAIGTLPGVDGETTIILGDAFDCLGLNLVFDGVLDTPSREVSVSTVQNEQLLTVKTASSATRVQIYANDDREPDQIVVLVSTVTGSG